MPDEIFDNPDFARFYDADVDADIPRWDEDYCAPLAANAKSVLDLGCGTGVFCTRVAAGRRVVGVDPARGMLGVARARPGADQVRWVHADARDVRLNETFDLVVMLGHAFQCLLTDDDQGRLCHTIAAHLAPGGTFVFDSRNPARELWREWTPEKTTKAIADPVLGQVTSWHDMLDYDAQHAIATYGTSYRIEATSKTIHAPAQIRFASKDEIAARIDEAGLAVRQWLGDWLGTPWSEGGPEIIPVGGLKI